MKLKVALVGSPNVGKSAVFNRLTGRYAAVSNYPGTTVEVARGEGKIGRHIFEVIDTPGLYSIYPISEEERVALRIITDERPDLIVHIIDAKNLERSLSLTFQLKETGIPLILVLNMFDELRAKGMNVNTELLAKVLDIPVVATVAVTGQGIEQLIGGIEDARIPLPLPPPTRGGGMGEGGEGVGGGGTPELPAFSDRLMRTWYARAHEITERVVIRSKGGRGSLSRLDKILISPITGFPVLAAVVYLGLYKFVGVIGAGTVVDLLERGYEGYLTPWFERIVEVCIPIEVMRGLFIGEYGILTLGLRYAIAIILPIVAFFFLVFAIIEDSGYLPRIAFLLDRFFKRVGLSGRAIIPMVLGLGCVTMATMVTRTLTTRRERFIATVLLSLCVPCSAQMGVIVGLLATRPSILVAWAAVIIAIFAVIGTLLARLVPGARPFFVIEIPPMRMPIPKNVLVKTYTRMVWYFKEVIPLFVLISAFMWLCQITGAFDWIIRAMSAPLAAMGLPNESANAFLLGFFRRDYGAAGFYDLYKTGIFTGNQLFIAAVVLTLFLPCITQLIMTIKERGWRIGMGISFFVLFFAFFMGVALYHILNVFRMQF